MSGYKLPTQGQASSLCEATADVLRTRQLTGNLTHDEILRLLEIEEKRVELSDRPARINAWTGLAAVAVPFLLCLNALYDKFWPSWAFSPSGVATITVAIAVSAGGARYHRRLAEVALRLLVGRFRAEETGVSAGVPQTVALGLPEKSATREGDIALFSRPAFWGYQANSLAELLLVGAGHPLPCLKSVAIRNSESPFLRSALAD